MWRIPEAIGMFEELLEERGVPIAPRDDPALGRQIQFPCWKRRFIGAKRPVWVSWRMDETYIKVKGQWRYLYRAVDKQGQTIDFLLTEHRDKEAALRFLKKAIRRHGVPEKITIDAVTPMKPPSRATTRNMAPISSSVR